MSEFRPEVRALIQAGRMVLLPTPADRERVFAALSVRLGFTADLPPPALVASKASLSWQALSALAAGFVVATVATYSALFGSYASSRAPLRVTAPAAVRAAATVPVASFAIEEAVVSPQASAPAASEARAFAPKSPERRSDGLSAEVALLARAEAELHAGRFASALKALDEHARVFPRGVLAPERIAARVHALCGLGRASEAMHTRKQQRRDDR